MLINLTCSEQLKNILTEMIESRGLSINPDAKLTLVEKGFDLPTQGISLLFDYYTLNDLTTFLDNLSRRPDSNKTIITGRRQDSEKYEILCFDDIMYFEAEGNYTYCFTGDSKFRVKNKLYELEAHLLEQGFIRISKSWMVNIMNVFEIIPWFGSRLLLKLKNKQEIEVSRSYVKNFKEFLEI